MTARTEPFRFFLVTLCFIQGVNTNKCFEMFKNFNFTQAQACMLCRCRNQRSFKFNITSMIWWPVHYASVLYDWGPNSETDQMHLFLLVLCVVAYSWEEVGPHVWFGFIFLFIFIFLPILTFLSQSWRDRCVLSESNWGSFASQANV